MRPRNDFAARIRGNLLQRNRQSGGCQLPRHFFIAPTAAFADFLHALLQNRGGGVKPKPDNMDFRTAVLRPERGKFYAGHSFHAMLRARLHKKGNSVNGIMVCQGNGRKPFFFRQQYNAFRRKRAI